MLVLDERARIVDANPAACRLSGYSHDELTALRVSDLTPPGARPGLGALWRRLGRATELTADCDVLRKDRTVRHADCRAVGRFAPHRHLVVLHDVTDRRRAEQALRAQYRLLQAIVDNVPVMLDLIDEAGSIEWVNREWERVLGWSRAEARWTDVFGSGHPGFERLREAGGLVVRDERAEQRLGLPVSAGPRLREAQVGHA